MTDLYTLKFDERYSFFATVENFICDEIPPYGWKRERIILKDIKILEGENYIPFEPELKMECGKQFEIAKIGDCLTFNANVGIVEPCYHQYDCDHRGDYHIEIGMKLGYRDWFNTTENFDNQYEEFEKRVDELEDFREKFYKDSEKLPLRALENKYGYIDFCFDYFCDRVRRLKNPSKVKIVSTNKTKVKPSLTC